LGLSINATYALRVNTEVHTELINSARKIHPYVSRQALIFGQTEKLNQQAFKMFDKGRFISYKNTLNGDLISRKFPSDLHTPLTHSQFPLYNSHFKVKKLIATLADSLKHPIP
jgi:hypothetical protein